LNFVAFQAVIKIIDLIIDLKMNSVMNPL